MTLETEVTDHPTGINSSDNLVNNSEVIAAKGRRRCTVGNNLMCGKLDPHNQIRRGRNEISEISDLVIDKIA